MKTDMPEWLQKCLSCIHSYHKQDDADTIYCRCRNGNCNYKEKQKIGHWIIIDDCEHFIAKCSECGQIEDSRMINNYSYCHCGAKMIKPQEKEK